MELDETTRREILQELHHDYDYNVVDREDAAAAADAEDMPRFAEWVRSLTDDEYDTFTNDALPRNS